MPENLWPDFARGHRRTIKTILMELGSGIEERTGGTIKFDVTTSIEGVDHYKHRCRLYVEPIDYLYPLFIVAHTASPFPLTTTATVLGQPRVSHNESEFVGVFKEIITSESTRDIVEQLLDAVS